MQSSTYAAIETGVDLGLFTVLSCDDTPKNATYLAEATGADPAMLCKANLTSYSYYRRANRTAARILKHLAAMGVITETGPDVYRRTGFSTSLISQRYSDGYPCM